MSRRRSSGRLLSVGVLAAMFAFSCGGESSSSDDGSGDDDDSGGTGGAQGGSPATGGTGPTGGATPTGGTAPTGGTSGTGGEPPDGMCDDVMPCGGDPTGSWVVRENCLEVVVPGLFDEPGCENVLPVGSAMLEGTFTFENGIATQSTQMTVDVTVVIDDPCAQALSGIPGVTAEQLCPLIDGMLMMDPETPADCVATTGGCRCDGTQTPEPTMESDTYEVVGNRLLVGTDEVFDFCQEGDELSLSGATVDADTGAPAEILLLLDRQ